MKNLKLKGSKNIRDIGGIKTEYGYIKSGLIFRGSHLSKLSDRDISILENKYNITAIVDLRSSRERIEKPDVDIPGTEYYRRPIFDSAVKGVTHEQKSSRERSASSEKSGGGSKAPNLCELYRTMVLDECIDNLGKVMEVLLNRKASDGAVLIHCTEGKDRTGIVMLTLLSLLKAPRESIMEDYLYTNTVNRRKAMKYYYGIMLMKHDKERAEEIRDVFLAKEEYLNSAIDEIEKNWGDFESFVSRGMGIDSDVIEAFRREFTE